MKPQYLAMLAGICFGTWPMILNRSGAKPFASMIMLSVVVVAFAAIPAGKELASGELKNTLMGFVFLAALFDSIGLLSFNTMLLRVSREEVGAMFLIMIMIQITIPALTTLYFTGWSLRKTCGIACAFLAVYLLKG